MMALRVFRLMSDLKMAVEVGLVVGTIPQMMPIGSAIVMVPKVSSSDRTPQVFRLYKRCKCIRKRSGFDHFVFNDAHAGFGYGHFGERIRASAAARAAARKILSTCS
nr:Uncharacterised protein [Klebsiella pneumoniae]